MELSSKQEFKMNKKLKRYSKWVLKNKFLVLVLAIFILEVFLRFYQIEERNPFGYDQVDNAWAAKNIIVNHEYPLVGMVAKGNSGIYIGPAYYYFVSFFYYITNLNPIASGIIAGVTSIFSLWILYFVSRKLFNKEVALIAIILNTFNFNVIFYFDRIQWPVNFIPGLSLLILYLLYKVITGDVKKLVYLALAIGIMFHIHFTAVLFPLMVLLSLPLFPRTLETLKYALISIPIFILCIAPQILYIISNKTFSSNSSYLNTSYHGFHLRRALQIINDAFIQFNHFVIFEPLQKIKLLFPVLFSVVYLKRMKSSDNLRLLYLMGLWFVVPWIVFTTYRGEISDYYFAPSRFVALIMLSYLIYVVWSIKSNLIKAGVVIMLAFYVIYNLSLSTNYRDVGLAERRVDVLRAVEREARIEFTQGAPESYLYYYYMRRKGVEVY